MLHYFILKIFRKPYEYNAVLMEKDHNLQSTCINKQRFADTTLCINQSHRNKAAKSEEIGRLRYRQHTTWNESVAQNSLAARSSVTVPSLLPRFVTSGQSNNIPSAPQRFSAFAGMQRFQNRPPASTINLRNHIHHCDARSGILPRTTAGFNVRPNETADCRGEMMQFSRMGAMISEESAEYMRRTASMLHSPMGLNTQNSPTRFGVSVTPTHGNHVQPVAHVNASAMAHPHVRAYGNACAGNDYIRQSLSQHTEVSRSNSAKTARQINLQNKGKWFCALVLCLSERTIIAQWFGQRVFLPHTCLSTSFLTQSFASPTLSAERSGSGDAGCSTTPKPRAA